MLYQSINGVQQNQLSSRDRGFAYGDGFFTTAKINNGVIEFKVEHLKRLKKSSTVLNITPIDFEQLDQTITTLARSYSLAVIKVVITAGEGGRGYARVQSQSPTIVIAIFEFPSHYLQWQQLGINLGVAQTQLGLNPLLQGIKHLNRLEQVIIRAELDKLTYDDIVVCDLNNQIIETSCANIFWQQGNVWFTPILTNAGVNGVIRQKILTLFPEVREVEVNVNELHNVDAMFICNSVMGIVPINTFHEKKLANKSNVFSQCLGLASD